MLLLLNSRETEHVKKQAVLLELKPLRVNSKLGNELIVGRGRPPMLVAVAVGVDITHCTVELLNLFGHGYPS